MKYSLLMTVFDREPEVLLSTLRSLSRCDMRDAEIVIVNDGSHLKYDFVQAYLDAKFKEGLWIDIEPYEAFRLEDGSNNPARAFNRAVLASSGDNLVAMSSDVIVPPRTMKRMRAVDLSQAVWTPYVEDTDGHIGGEYCGPKRLFPAPWFTACTRDAMYSVKGWDERYLGGLCYEDNDIVARLALHVGRFMGDWSVKVFHQGHYQVAYDAEKAQVLEANARNRELTMQKWSGIPFDAEFTPFDVIRKMHKSGNVAHECQAIPGRLAKTIEETNGLVADAATLLTGA